MNTREAAVLGHVPVGARQDQTPVGPPRAGRPDLRPVEHPLVAVAHRGGLRAGDVGSACRLGQELHPDLVAAEDGGEVLRLLLLGSVVEEQGRARLQRRNLEARPGTRSGQISSLRACWCAGVRPWPPYSVGKQIPANPASNSRRCRSRWCATSASSSSSVWRPCDIAIASPGRAARGMLSAQPGAQPAAEVLDRFDALPQARASSLFSNMVVSRWR